MKSDEMGGRLRVRRSSITHSLPNLLIHPSTFLASVIDLHLLSLRSLNLLFLVGDGGQVVIVVSLVRIVNASLFYLIRVNKH